MDSIKNSLTIESLGNKFTSHFELVNYAITLAQNLVQGGRGCRVPTAIQNPAFWVLLEISQGKDTFDEILTEASDEETKETVAKKALEQTSTLA